MFGLIEKRNCIVEIEERISQYMIVENLVNRVSHGSLLRYLFCFYFIGK